ncbi:SMR family transporter [Amantichitinum ursilacus]|uniref:Putative 4-amino-4-deoxy-L-arabinose-phosphoundecaprenol flippase subunit ArnF n=1 Tax=Amantichitinum ursilacus TaxID=857265 RepID=A0A0N0XKT5_9NEIS|nr:SMR family transporter [Amantichitinum ursilacus]KPC55057.1 putative 4-amino-4-deoxy-L-arabinose-phosphoundecaprenol flippase subunit ArnF [Amantichitinum ursilacus]
MKLAEFALIVFGVLLNAAAQLLLKAGTRQVGHFDFSISNAIPIGWQIATNPYVFGGLCCYAISLVVWILALSRVEVSVAYPMLSLGYVVNVFLAWQLFGEALSTQKLSGVAIILVGVYLVARS